MTITASVIADSVSPEGIQRQCSKCGVIHPADRFQHFNGRPSGQCRGCKTEAMRLNRRAKGIPVRPMTTIIDGRKKCLSCLEAKPFEEFYPTARGRGGLAAYCKPCVAARPSNAEAQRKATTRYRKRHSERWRALHRLSMFKRRHLIEASSDGTVTDSLLKQIYSREFCCYCHEFTPEEKRTLEHIIPLSRGGSHSERNIDMACFSCNSSKAAKLPEEFNRKSS